MQDMWIYASVASTVIALLLLEVRSLRAQVLTLTNRMNAFNDQQLGRSTGSEGIAGGIGGGGPYGPGQGVGGLRDWDDVGAVSLGVPVEITSMDPDAKHNDAIEQIERGVTGRLKTHGRAGGREPIPPPDPRDYVTHPCGWQTGVPGYGLTSGRAGCVYSLCKSPGPCAGYRVRTRHVDDAVPPTGGGGGGGSTRSESYVLDYPGGGDGPHGTGGVRVS